MSTSHPGYVLSYQTPPACADCSKTVKLANPALLNLTAAATPPRPPPMIAILSPAGSFCSLSTDIVGHTLKHSVIHRHRQEMTSRLLACRIPRQAAVQLPS